MTEEELFWRRTTGPFADTHDNRPARIRIHQVSDNEFALEESFHYLGGDQTVLVDSQKLTQSNLATIPGYLGWFMRRHGRHTPAALMHDQLVGENQPGPDVPFPTRVGADAAFRSALMASGVPPVRAWLMWTAVTLNSRFHAKGRTQALIELWVISAVIGLTLFCVGLSLLDPVLIVATAVAPLLAAFLWGEQWKAGVIAGYAVPVVVLGTIPSVVAYHAYWIVEKGFGLGRPTPDPPTFYER